MFMTSTLEIRAGDEIIQRLPFKPYRNSIERRAVQFLPGPNEPQTTNIQTPWGETLMCKYGDYIVSEMSAPKDRWPVDREIFEASYLEVQPGSYVKRPLTYLVPLVDVTGNPNQQVVVRTMEGDVTVRAGDFYLARGIKGEIWPYPKDKADTSLILADSWE
ncbi:MAG TPA: hypothetical protein PLD25_31900 [Chloroflexota bacterium]|nr:hypothetical protein [Chloroflexota bacterium]HUM69452.1 hypothetical protein [Chloroflexota bacterium]